MCPCIFKKSDQIEIPDRIFICINTCKIHFQILWLIKPDTFSNAFFVFMANHGIDGGKGGEDQLVGTNLPEYQQLFDSNYQ